MKSIVKTMGKRLPLIALILGVGLAVASTTHFKSNSKNSNYWVYTSSATSGFRDAAKYEIQSLSSPEEIGCSNDFERPCVLMATTASTSTATQLQSYLNTLGDDNDVLSHSATTKE